MRAGLKSALQLHTDRRLAVVVDQGAAPRFSLEQGFAHGVRRAASCGRCEAGRYHSLITEPASLPPELLVTARTAEGEIMGLRHGTLRVEGVQFHPESVLTPTGPAMMKNFLEQRA